MGLNENIHRADQVKADESLFTKNLIVPEPNLKELEGIAYWMKADDGVIYDGSNKVEHVGDHSGNEHHAVQLTPGAQFEWQDNQVNGKPAIYMDTSQYMTIANPVNEIAFNSNYSVFVVWKGKDDSPTNLRTIYALSSTSEPYKRLISSSTYNNDSIYTTHGGRYEATAVGNFMKDWAVTSANIRTGDNNNEVWMNETPFVGGNSNNTGLTDLIMDELGRVTDWGGSPYKYSMGWLAEYILFDRVVTETERLYVEEYLLKKYGIKTYQMKIQDAYEIIDSWSPILHSDNANFYDSFVYGANVTYTLGENWVITSGNGGSTAFAVDEVNHPGIFQFTTGTSVNGNGEIHSFSDTIYLSEGVVFEAQVKCDIIESQDSVNWGVFHAGLGVDTGLFDAGCTDAVIFKVGGTTNGNEIVLSTRDGGSETETFTGVNMSNNTWYNLRWEYTGGLVKIYIDEVSTIDRDNLTFIDSVAIDIPTAAMKRRVGMQIGNGSVPVSYNGFIDHFLIEQPTIR